MPTNREIYGPIIEARHDPALFESRLKDAGTLIHKRFPDQHPTVRDGYLAAVENLRFYSGHYSDPVPDEVRRLLPVPGLGMMTAPALGMMTDARELDLSEAKPLSI